MVSLSSLPPSPLAEGCKKPIWVQVSYVCTVSDVCRRDIRGKVKRSVAPAKLFITYWTLQNSPQRLPAASPPPPSLGGRLAGETRLSRRRQVNFHISIRMESGVFCCVNDSMAVSICVALAGLERRLLNKGCRRRRREKRSRLSISRLGEKKNKRLRRLISLPWPLLLSFSSFLCLISFRFFSSYKPSYKHNACMKRGSKLAVIR